MKYNGFKSSEEQKGYASMINRFWSGESLTCTSKDWRISNDGCGAIFEIYLKDVPVMHLLPTCGVRVSNWTFLKENGYDAISIVLLTNSLCGRSVFTPCQGKKEAEPLLNNEIRKSLTDTSRVHVFMSSGYILVELDWEAKDDSIYTDGITMYAKMDDEPDPDEWLYAQHLGAILADRYNLPLVISEEELVA